MGPLRPESVVAVQAFSRCGDLAAGFTRLVCTSCGHQHLLAFSGKARHLCPAGHQRRTLQSTRWFAHHVCLPVPHRQFVFTIPKILRPIFRKRRHLLTHLSRTLPPSPRALGGPCQHPPPPDPPFHLDTFEPIDPPWPAIREWIPSDEHDPQAVFPGDSVSTHWTPRSPWPTPLPQRRPTKANSFQTEWLSSTRSHLRHHTSAGRPLPAEIKRQPEAREGHEPHDKQRPGRHHQRPLTPAIIQNTSRRFPRRRGGGRWRRAKATAAVPGDRGKWGLWKGRSRRY